MPRLASVHTRFETYPRYYRLAFAEPWLEGMIRRFYNRCDAIVAPSESMADVLRAQGMNGNIGLWSRGVDRDIFDPSRRDLAWRRALGIADEDVAIGFLGRLVMEKGLDVFSDADCRTEGARRAAQGAGGRRRPGGRVVPRARARGELRRLPAGAPELARAVASMDVLLNPSITETFGNVTLEAMASGVPVIAARATGSTSLGRRPGLAIRN